MDGIEEQVLTVFPDADPEHVRAKVAQAAMASNDKAAQFEFVVQELLSSDYPKKLQELDLTDKDPVQAAKELEDKNKCIQELCGLFSDVDIRWLEGLYDQTFSKQKNSATTAEIVGNYLIENPGYPKRPVVPKPVIASRSNASNVLDLTDSPTIVRTASGTGIELGREPAKDYDDTKPQVSLTYKEMCEAYLSNEFCYLSATAIKQAMAESNNHFTPARKKLRAKYGEVPDLWPENVPPPNPTVKLMKSRRKQMPMPAVRDEEFIRELAWAKREDEWARAEREWKNKSNKNANGADGGGDEIECGCCCCEYPFDEMVQCNEGHLFCRECLKKYVEETVFGQGQTEVHCLDGSGCKERFAISQLQRALPPKMYKKLVDRIADLEVRKAGIENLHQCPHCDYMAEVANPDEKVFKCMNPECGKETCILCKEPSHIPLRCEEVEKKHETDFRKTIEEELSEALVRVCPKCKARFLKSDGCNKISCQCGTLLCYVCRETIPPKIGYSHFCAHTRSPMHMGKCKECNKCYLFLKDTEAEDEKLVEAARKAAEERARAQNPDLAAKVKEIGGKDDGKPKKKKAKKNDAFAAAVYNPVGHAVMRLQNLMAMGGYHHHYDSDDDDDSSDSDSDNSDDMEVERGYRVYHAPPVPVPMIRAPPPPVVLAPRVAPKRPATRKRKR
eukprot:TRINITY_DN11511_c0_g1_i1.p1 TRINITY_DN11511_c0_g1~~TRINITY_DN11511_c0_g1_i1.p1  ORF type:complete len:674 (+),score=114.40 TRINITY_DN11511_c0_g1_i1:55-2076(+)